MTERGVMVSREGRETKFWARCEPDKALEHVRGFREHFPEYFDPATKGGKVRAEYGESVDNVFAPSEVLDLSPLGL
jgi:hypothetical protein